jgi:hypothetical protein
MRREAKLFIGVAAPVVLVLLLPDGAIAGGPSCVRREYVHVWRKNTNMCDLNPHDGVPFAEPCWLCNGTNISCPDFVRVHIRATRCDGTFEFTGGWGGEGCPGCPSTADWMASNPAGLVFENPCGSGTCDFSSQEEPTCDGLAPEEPIDEGCQGNPDERECFRDPYPVHLGSGRVETRAITPLALPPIGGLSLEVSLGWGSHTRRQRAVAYGGDTVPTVRSVTESTHFAGDNWIDNYSDRLIIRHVSGAPETTFIWIGRDKLVSFTGPSSPYFDGKGAHVLIDRGAGNDPQYVITTLNKDGNPHQQWGFQEATYTDRSGEPFRMGHLVRRAVAADRTDYTGFYSITIARLADGRIDTVTDSLGHTLDYTHELVDSQFYRVSQIQYLAYPSATPLTVATFSYTLLGGGPTQSHGWHLERIDMPTSYRRFRYLRFGNANNGLITKCDRCDGMLVDVIAPAGSLSSTTPQAPVVAGEVVTEHHEYEYSEVAADPLPRAVRSSGVGGEFAYVYDDVNANAIQFDLRVGGTACGAGCAAGYQCYEAADGGDDKCYLAKRYAHDFAYRVTGTSSSTGATSSEIWGPDGAPLFTTDDAGIITTYGFGSDGQLRCLVRNDDDIDAFADPDNPDTSVCDPPASGPSQVVRIANTATSETKQTPSVINVGQSTTTTSSVNLGTRIASNTEFGYTHDIDGTLLSETHVSTQTFDSLWRPVSKDGPLPNSVAYDVTDISYHSTSGTLDYGHVSSISRYVGTSASHAALTTSYSQYDQFGVPHLVVQPGGQSVLLTASTDRLTWTIAHRDPSGAVVGTSEVILNPDGTLRSAKDPDGVCLTYEYRTASGVFVGAPTVIKRSTGSSCGAIPIVQSSGEVELRTYVNDDPRRLASVTRKTNGTTEFTYSGFTYDPDRRLVGATTLDSMQPYSFEFTDGIPTATTAPGGAGGGGWRTETGADEFGRPTHLWRMLNAAGTSKQAYTFEYETDFTPRPTRLIRGQDATQASVTEFIYDDFGRLVESSVPEQGNPGPGITRFEYDAAGNLVKERIGVGTALVRTSVRTYDSLGRLLSVDHDTEHPVDCATAPTGTKIQDEEYRYDSCSGDYPSGSCANTLGRLTVSRAILHCASNQTIKRGKWYSYDSAGRLASVQYATVTGSTIGTPAEVVYTYTSAGRLQSLTSPLSTTYGTKYTYNGSGLVSTVETSATTPSPIASSLTYRAFGPLSGLITPVTLPGPKTLKLDVTRRSDDAITNLSWATTGTPTYFINQTFTYTPAGLLQLRDDIFGPTTRYYEYDSLQRLTCEARGEDPPAPKVNPTSADCQPSSARLVGQYTYHDGTATNAPPDVRASAFTKTTGYVSAGAETYTYSGGSGMISGINRSVGHLTLGHDVIGRRIHDYDNFDATRSRRDYTYLPNGQLASISGQTPTGVPYAVAVNYGPDGHPLTISETGGSEPDTTFEIFYDDAGHLLAAQITVASATPKYVTWNYHYVGDTPLAATRITQIGTNTPTVKRFWLLSDERGLIYRVLDDQGVEHWNSHWDAQGWRTTTTQAGGPIDMWVPFALPGQLALSTTSAYASNGTTTHTRPSISLARWRSYDPLTGVSLQPDRADLASRLEPEGYVYARANAVSWHDATGDESEPMSGNVLGQQISPSCAHSREKILIAINYAILKIQGCTGSTCSVVQDNNTKRAWINRLATSGVHCPTSELAWQYRLPNGYAVWRIDTFGDAFAPWWMRANNLSFVIPGVTVRAFSSNWDESNFQWDIFLAPVGIPSDGVFFETSQRPLECLSLTIAHEALHGVIFHDRSGGIDDKLVKTSNAAEEDLVDENSTRCISGC